MVAEAAQLREEDDQEDDNHPGLHMMEKYPDMYPFDVQKMGRCVRIEPKDIGHLPITYWSLAGNRFLLHGYYCYRHLIFGRKQQGIYCLGVPGVYCDREKNWQNNTVCTTLHRWFARII